MFGMADCILVEQPQSLLSDSSVQRLPPRAKRERLAQKGFF